jgi:predicted short-subunit dehydrogenase-like oxidoreductase (DUF2520 family)
VNASGRQRAALIGPGRLGTLVAHALNAAGIPLVTVAGGSETARERLCSAIAGARPSEVAAAPVGATLVVLAVPDGAIAGVVDELARAGTLDETHGVVHLAGVHGLAPLRRAGLAGARIAALHPVVTAPSGAQDPALLHGAAWAVTTVAGDRAWAHDLVHRLGGDAFDVPDGARVRYHAALATASNAVGAAVVTARRLLRASGIDEPERLLAPLARASLESALQSGAPALTGPIVRGDVGTIAAHLAALGPEMPELNEAYRVLARAVLASVGPSLAPDTVDALRDLLADAPR